jgi:NAD(P)-dependent dehydrogenase (short-subunit alcohol dehydrogenase family)
VIDTPATQDERAGSLAGQTVVVIGGSSGMGLETARQAKAAGASLILTGRDPRRLEQAGDALEAQSTSELDLDHPEQLDSFFAELPATIDHVFVTGSGPPYTPIPELDFDQVRRALEEHLTGSLRIAKACVGRVRAGGSLTLITGTYARRPGIGLVVAAIEAAAVPAIVANIAVELAPMRANAIAAGFVDTPLSGRLLGDGIERRREELRATLPIRRVVGPADVAALVIQLMTNTAVTGATFDIDGGQQLLP